MRLDVAASLASILLVSACDGRCEDLHAAVAAGDRARFEQLATDGDVACTDRDDWTLLHVAARHGHDELVTLLLDRGASIDAPGNVGRSPLYEAAKYGQLATVRLLADRGAQLDAASAHGFTPLIVAAERYHLAIVEELLDRGAAPGAVQQNGQTALQQHIQYLEHVRGDPLALTRLLIDRGVPLEVHDGLGRTAVYAAAQHGALAILRLLLEAGANPNATRNDGYTPMDAARANGHDEVVQLLAQHGGRVGGRAARPRTLRPLPAQVTRTGTVVRASGPGAIPVGTPCTVTARPVESDRYNCQLDATCGGRRLYGGGRLGFAACGPTPSGVRAFDPFGTPDDGDPAAELDTEAGRFVADDNLPGAQGTSVQVRLEPAKD